MLEDSPYDLTGKIALITGAAGLLGIEHASALAATGAKIVLTDVNTLALESTVEKLKQSYPHVHVQIQVMDVTQPAAIAQVQDYLQTFGGVDILINNAAVDPKVTAEGDVAEMSRFEHFPLAQWSFQLNVGLTGAYLCSQVFGTAMAARGSGVILNIASDLSVIAPDQRLYQRPDRPADQQPVKPVTYSVIKTALIGLTRYLATYWAESGVRVNALSPGGIFNEQDPVFIERLTQLIPMGRMADRHEYRGVVQFLCSDASRYMTGQNLVVDGGRSVL